jgi:carboxyl-terminal processing protease
MISAAFRGPRAAARLALAVALVLAGMWLGGHPGWIPSSIRGAFVSQSSGRLVEEVLDTISRDYYRPVNRAQLLDKGLAAMVASLHDPYSHYYDPAAYRSFLSQSNPHLSGIGIDVIPDSAGLRVVDVFPQSPAARAGLAHGDLIVAVDGTSLAGRTAGFASSLIRGRPGTRVRLTIKRGRQLRQVTVVRQRLVIPVASAQLITYHEVRIGYLRLTAFTSDAGSELRGDVDGVLGRGARGLILDLRENGGGLLDQAVNVASIFIPDGTIVTTRGRSQPTQVYTAHGGAISTSIPLVVLVDHDTASAAEIVTAALQQRGRAKVVGTRTYGKGVYQEIEPLPGGGALDLTVGEYFTPNGTNLGGGGVREGRGVRPDIYVAESLSSPRDRALEVAEATVAAEVR